MLSWFTKKKAPSYPSLSIHDYPRKEYSAYWEIFESGDNCAQVRVLGYEGTIQREIETFTATTKEGRDNKVNEFLSHVMAKYKRT
jgi:hypothetical protein